MVKFTQNKTSITFTIPANSLHDAPFSLPYDACLKMAFLRKPYAERPA